MARPPAAHIGWLSLPALPRQLMLPRRCDSTQPSPLSAQTHDVLRTPPTPPPFLSFRDQPAAMASSRQSGRLSTYCDSAPPNSRRRSRIIRQAAALELRLAASRERLGVPRARLRTHDTCRAVLLARSRTLRCRSSTSVSRRVVGDRLDGDRSVAGDAVCEFRRLGERLGRRERRSCSGPTS